MPVSQAEFSTVLAAIQYIESAKKIDSMHMLDRRSTTQARLFDPGSELQYILYNIQDNADGSKSLVFKPGVQASKVVLQNGEKYFKSLEVLAREYFRDHILPTSIKNLLQDFIRKSVTKDGQLIDGAADKFIYEILKPVFDDLYSRFKEANPKLNSAMLVDQTKYLMIGIMMNAISAEKQIPQVFKSMVSTHFNDFLKAIIFFYSDKDMLDNLSRDQAVVQRILREDLSFSATVQKLETEFYEPKFKSLLTALNAAPTLFGILEAKKHQLAKYILSWERDSISSACSLGREKAAIDAASIKFTEELRCSTPLSGSEDEEHPTSHVLSSLPQPFVQSISLLPRVISETFSSFSVSEQFFSNSFTSEQLPAPKTASFSSGCLSSSCDFTTRRVESSPVKFSKSITKPLSFITRVFSSTPTSSTTNVSPAFKV